MKIDILTLFPEMFSPLDYSIAKRGVEKGLVEINITNIRDFTTDKHHHVDDIVYGGGVGMLIKPEPVFKAVEAVKIAESAGKKVEVILTSPAGETYNQKIAQELSEADQVIILCGHYEGFDNRIEEELVTRAISIGDYVLTGGEMPAIIMTESIIRLVSGVLGDDASSEDESHSAGLLEYPQYTRPAEFRGKKVPDCLQNGNHKEIEKWRREESLKRTYKRRKELLSTAALTKEDKKFLATLQAENKDFNLWVALVHYPVYNKKHEVVNTSITNLDIHDIARAAATFDFAGYFIVQPQEGQKQMIGNLLRHWKKGFGANYNPDRNYALSRVNLVDSLEETVVEIEKITGNKPHIIGTSAQASENMIGYKKMTATMQEQGGDYLLVLGTGYGLIDEIMQECDYVLRPVYGVGEYNHLSVRSAASIMFDRLLGEKESNF